MILEFMPKRIIITYRNSGTGVILEFSITDSMYNGEHYCEIVLKALARSNKFVTKHEEGIFGYAQFSKIFEKLISLDFKDICLKNDFMNLNCPSLGITLEYGGGYLILSIPDHERDIERRGLKDINNIFKDLLDKFNTDDLALLLADDETDD